MGGTAKHQQGDVELPINPPCHPAKLLFMHIGALRLQFCTSHTTFGPVSPPRMAQITHSQIAQRSGLSRSTVSRALQNHPAIPLETRQRVQRIATELGYRPNPFVSALMAARCRPSNTVSTATLAVLTAWQPTESLAPDASLQRFMRGSASRASELGYSLEEFWMDEPGMSHVRLNQILINRGIVAIMLAPLPGVHPDVWLDWEHFSVGAFAPSAQFPRFHRASHFHFGGACLAVEEVHRRGYTRPGLIISSQVQPHFSEQWLGGLAAMDSRGLFSRKIPSLVMKTDSLEQLQKWLDTQRPDVVIGNDLRIPQWLTKLHYRIPEDIAFANLDRPMGDEYGGVDQLKEIIGRTVVDLIVAQVHCNERGIPHHAKDTKLAGVWVDGRSVRRAP